MNAFDIPLQPQRQDSLTNQMQDVFIAATRLGCYDAADWLNTHFKDADDTRHQQTD